MISKLHYITQEVKGFTHAQLAEKACKGGIDWVQLRIKNMPYEELKEQAIETLYICRKYGAKLIINDNVLLAKEIEADGVHLGKEDMSPVEARKILGNDFIIGGTANTFEDIVKHVNAGVNYIGLGPYKYTATKEKLSAILGIDGYIKIMKACRVSNINTPIVAIGGILQEDVDLLLEAGLHGIALASTINLSNNVQSKARELMNHLVKQKEESLLS